MVATQSAAGAARAARHDRVPSRHGRAVATAIVATFLLTILPMPVAQAQVGPDVYVTQGEAVFYQTNFHSGNVGTYFIDNSSSPTNLSLKVWNTAAPLQNVPVYYFFPGGSGECRLVNIPQGTTSEPVFAWANFTLTTRSLPEGGNNLTISVFGAPPDEVPESACNLPSGQRIARAQGSVTGTGCVQPYSCRLDDTSNNGATVHYVKQAFLNLQIRSIRWCSGDPSLVATCDDMIGQDGAALNVTPAGAGLRASFFEVEVANVGTHHSLANHSGTAGAGWQYALNVTVLGQGISPPWFSAITSTTSRIVDDADMPTHRARSAPLYINGLAGAYNVTVWADREGVLRRAGGDTSVDKAERDVEVAFRDFAPNITASNFRTSAATAYEHEGGGQIRGNVTFKNLGPAEMPPGAEVKYRIYLDNLTQNTVFKHPLTGQATFSGLGAAGTETSSRTVEILWDFSGTTTSSRYLPPGRHTLIAEIDYDGVFVEGNETNNRTTLDIFVKDSTKPTFAAAPIISLAGVSGASVTQARPHEPLNVHIDVRDEDNALTVVGNFTLNSNKSVYRTYDATRIGNQYFFRASNLSYHNFSARAADGSENWTLKVTANDSFGNTQASADVPLKLIPWPIHRATEPYVILEPVWPEGTNQYATDPDPRWRIRVEPNMTGFDGRSGVQQQMHVANLALNITTLQDTFDMNASFWQADSNPTACPPTPPPGRQPGTVPDVDTSQQPTCIGRDLDNNNTFTLRFAKAQDRAGPGVWNYSLRIADVSGEERVINGTLHVQDSRPEVRYANINLSAVVPVADNATTVRITGNFTDDSNRVSEVRVNFTRFEPNDSVRVNFSVPLVDDWVDPETAVTYYNHSLLLEVGRGHMFGLGGKFATRLEVRDLAGNWNSHDLGTFEVKDDAAPRVQTQGVLPANPEVGENVTFYATATDTTNVSMRFEVFRTSTVGELLFDAVIVNQSETMNYTFQTNFTAEAIHAWRVTPVDGANRAGEARLSSITVRDNLGPKFDVRSPSTVIDGTRYGSGTPRIEIQVADIEGVIASSIDMKVAGLPVEFEIVPAPGNVTGFLVVYEVRAARKFSHQDLVEVNISAQDDSKDKLTSYLNFSFVVDDVAPTARLISASPSYRDQPGHVMNVSLATRFTLAAEDIDGLPTEVTGSGIRYRIIGGGPSAAETVYNGPFRINDAPGVYTGPRLYTIQFWAEDAVGNFNRNPNVTTVYVDDTPPALFQFFPQGRSVNATFVDDRVGVNRSVVWYRLNDQPYVPMSLTEREGAWSVLLPEGVKGDRISYYLQAWDRLDNTETFGNGTNPYASFDVSNHEPRIRIVGPVEGSRISRNVDLVWEASDEDGDALVYTVYMKAPGRTTFSELVKIENTAVKRYTIETGRYPDGQYTFRVAAGDGGFVKLAETTVTILNRVDAVGTVSVIGDALPGQTLLIKAEVTKAEAIVEARLYLGNELVNSWPMNDEGRDGDETAADGIYSVRVPVSSAGEHRVEIFTRYREDGELKESTMSSAATFTAKATPAYILSNYGAIIALIGLLAAVGIGVAVFVVMRRR